MSITENFCRGICSLNIAKERYSTFGNYILNKTDRRVMLFDKKQSVMKICKTNNESTAMRK